MDWIFDHPQVLILLGGAVIYWFNQWKKAREEAQEAQSRTATPPTASAAKPDAEAERVRRIQEEIRRKIQQRSGGGAGRPPPLRPAAQPVTPVPAATVKTTQPEEGGDQAVLQRQRELAAKVLELEAIRRETGQGRAAIFAETTTASLEDSAVRGSLLAELRDTSSVRRAVVLREVLGTPVGLR